MRKTIFAGLTVLAPGESLSEDGYSFQAKDPVTVDRFLELGAVTHRHDARLAMSSPTDAPSGASMQLLGTGAIPADTSIYVGYTWLDGDGRGETALAPTLVLTTDSPMSEPEDAPSATVDYTGGSLPAALYYYALTFTDDAGGETTIGPPIAIERTVGAASGQITLDGMGDIAASGGAAGWFMYRSKNGSQYQKLASGDLSLNSFVDDGTPCADCTPPPDVNTTGGGNSLEVTVPASMPSAASAFRLYLSDDGSFTTPALYGEFPPSSAGATIQIDDYIVSDGSPPDVSTIVPGAHKIDATTELDNLDAALGALGFTGGGGGGGGGGGPLLLGRWGDPEQPVELDEVTIGDWLEWRASGASASMVSMIGYRENVQNSRAYEDYVDPSGSIAGGYTEDGTTYLMPDPSDVGVDCQHPIPLAGAVHLAPGGIGGIVGRPVEFLASASHWIRTGVFIGGEDSIYNGVFANLYNDGTLKLETRDTGNAGAFVTLAEENIGGSPANGDTWFIDLQRIETTHIARVHFGKTSFEASANVDQAFIDAHGDYCGPADVYSNADAWRSDYVYADEYEPHYHLRARIGNQVGSDTEVNVLNEDGTTDLVPKSLPPVASGYVTDLFGVLGGVASASWQQYDNTDPNMPRYFVSPDARLHFEGKIKRVGSGAMAQGEKIGSFGSVGLPYMAFVVPKCDIQVPVVTGDDDGVQLGMLKVEGGTGDFYLLDGKLSTEAKSPYVDLAGLTWIGESS